MMTPLQIKLWMQEAGMHTWTDAVANVHGRIDGQNPHRPVLLIGSHYDTVKDAGKYDGALGILVGIAAVKALVVQVSLHVVHITQKHAGSWHLHTMVFVQSLPHDSTLHVVQA